MKSIKVFYMGKQLKDVYPHATKFQVFKWKVQEFLKSCVRFTAKVLFFAGIGYGLFTAGGYLNPTMIYDKNEVVIEVDTLAQKIENLKNETIEEIAHKESSNSKTEDALIIFDDNSRGTLSRKNKASIGCMQFKVSTVQHYVKILDKKDITNYDATITALNCDSAKALAKRVIFETEGGLWNWSVATKEMGAKVELIKQLQ
jgi:hypothetical protein